MSIFATLEQMMMAVERAYGYAHQEVRDHSDPERRLVGFSVGGSEGYYVSLSTLARSSGQLAEALKTPEGRAEIAASFGRGHGPRESCGTCLAYDVMET